MKNKSILSLLVFLMSFGVVTTSCEDMMTPEMDRYVDNFSGKDSVNFYLGILAGIQDMAENNVILGEIRGDLAEPTTYASDSITQIANFEALENGENGLLDRSAYYKVINQCNFYLAKVDTMVQKNNIFYMRKEFAQVQIMRAWTYMQLVQNYGEVPFITKPVDNASTGWELNSPEGTVTADNLLDKLLQNDLMRAYEYQKQYGLPNYGTFSTGAVDISHRMTIFPAELVLADLYLLRGKNTSDYEKAATFYYEFLEDYSQINASAAASKSVSIISGREHYSPVASGWANSHITNYSPNGEIITVVPSAANNSIGKTLTRVPQIYGFDPHSTTSSTGGDGSISVSGRISVTPNYKNRQVGPTPAYINLCEAQQYVDRDNNAAVEGMPKYLENLGDCRIDGTIKYLKTLGGRMPFVQKFSSRDGKNEDYIGGFTFRYTLPIYRLRQVYLRFAEAINRAGYPRHAFAVLRNGLASEKMPAVRLDSVVYNDVDSTYKVVPYLSKVGGEGCDYIGVDEMRRAKTHPEFLDFSDTKWRNTGIHSLGCGTSTEYDTVYTYENVVSQRMIDEAVRSGADESAVRKYAKQLAQTTNNDPTTQDSIIDRSEYTQIPSDEPVIPENLAYQINAVETLIADEMALETAYEGWRYYDLMRLARHKNNDNYGVFSGDFGTQWMAWKIARRSLDLKPYESPQSVDAGLYSKLLNTTNWFLQNPIYE